MSCVKSGFFEFNTFKIPGNFSFFSATYILALFFFLLCIFPRFFFCYVYSRALFFLLHIFSRSPFVSFFFDLVSETPHFCVIKNEKPSIEREREIEKEITRIPLLNLYTAGIFCSISSDFDRSKGGKFVKIYMKFDCEQYGSIKNQLLFQLEIFTIFRCGYNTLFSPNFSNYYQNFLNENMYILTFSQNFSLHFKFSTVSG